MKRKALVVLGVGAALAAASAVAFVFSRKRRPTSPSPPAPIPPELEGVARRAVPQVVLPTVALQPGTTYLGELSLGFVARALVTRAALVTGLEREGFIVLRAQQERPDFWPPSDGEPDWYLAVSYIGDTRTREMPEQVTRYWIVGAS